MTQTIPADADIDLALDDAPGQPAAILRAVAALPDRLVLVYLLGLAVIGAVAIIGMVTR